MSRQRQSTGIPQLDVLLGGGLIPGTLTVVVGATGMGKTQLGLQFLHAGLPQEGRRGVILDLSARGDSQNHAGYAQRMFAWNPREVNGQRRITTEQFFDANRNHGEYLHPFDCRGRKVTRQDLDFDQWRDWQAELNARLHNCIAFLYGNFVHGARRLLVDGVEPVARPNDSIQLHLFEYIYHQILRKDPQWVARDLFRQSFRQHAEDAARHAYPTQAISCLLLTTSHETMLDDLIARPLDDGDMLATANTLIYLGNVRHGQQLKRALWAAKHRGSACTTEITPYRIDDGGLRFD